MLKESKSDSFLKTVSAFANFGTGTILFGVNKDGDIVGVDDMQKLRLDIENSINDNINPIPNYTLEDDEKNKIVKLVVKEGLDKPYFYKSKSYMRRDTSTVEMDKSELRRLIMKSDGISYDSLKCNDENLSFNTLENKLKDKLNIDRFDMNTLKTLGLYTDKNGYNKAAELLADKNSDFGIDVVRFGDNINIILDRATVENVSIIEQYYSALEMFRHYYVYEEVTGAEREKKEKIPEKAFREAVANAIVHREWDINSNIRIAFYENRIEIQSPGGLPEGMTEENYLKDELSISRNPIIANVFLRLELIEKLGTGVQRINAEYIRSINKPIYYVSDNLIRVTLPLFGSITIKDEDTTPYTTPKGEDTTPYTTPKDEDTTPYTTPKDEDTTPYTTPKDEDTTPYTTPKDEDTTQKNTIELILTLVKDNNKITATEIANQIGITRDGVRYHLDNMKSKGIIRHCGTVQNGYWEILKKDLV